MRVPDSRPRIRRGRRSDSEKLDQARDDFFKEIAKAKSDQLGVLKAREEASKKAGDLKTLEKVLADIKAFEESGTLPVTVATKNYETSMLRSRIKLEAEYSNAIKAYTQAGKIEEAKSVDQLLADFKKEQSTSAGKRQPAGR